MAAEQPLFQTSSPVRPTDAGNCYSVQSPGSVSLILREMSCYAKGVEATLWDLAQKIREKTEEVERLRENIRRACVEEEEELSESFPIQGMAMLNEQMKSLMRDIARETEYKLRLLREVDRHVHGGPTPSLGDTFLYTTVVRSPIAAGFASLMENLPVSNVEFLGDEKFFVFAKSLIVSSIAQWKRMRKLDVCSCSLGAIRTAGHNVTLATAVSRLDDGDLEKL